MDPRERYCRRCSSGFPRTRGDGPGSITRAESNAQVSPHTRGWTRQLCDQRLRRGGFPAHAGMDPRERTASGRTARFPRTRGDGPVSEIPCAMMQMVSPHTRGWTLRWGVARDRERGFPAHAGMDPRQIAQVAKTQGFPRTRGDGPPCHDPTSWMRKVSPHTRGWTRRAGTAGHPGGGFPAHAGMDRRIPSAAAASTGFPRTRGDGPRSICAWLNSEMVSPHTRGWTQGHDGALRHLPGFPAHAGMDPTRLDAPASVSGFPRTRGDGPSSDVNSPGAKEVSPHTRGWTRRAAPVDLVGRGFPAHAGMDPGGAVVGGMGCGFPRTRGDGPHPSSGH